MVWIFLSWLQQCRMSPVGIQRGSTNFQRFQQDFRSTHGGQFNKRRVPWKRRTTARLRTNDRLPVQRQPCWWRVSVVLRRFVEIVICLFIHKIYYLFICSKLSVWNQCPNHSSSLTPPPQTKNSQSNDDTSSGKHPDTTFPRCNAILSRFVCLSSLYYESTIQVNIDK